jgi:hypothetical protein
MAQQQVNQKRELLNAQKQQKQLELLEKLRQIEESVKPISRKSKTKAQPVKLDSPELKKLQQKVLEKKQGMYN